MRRPPRNLLPVSRCLCLLIMLLIQGLVSASELRISGSLEHAWVVTRLEVGEPWQVYHLPATERLSTPRAAGQIPQGVVIDGLVAQDNTLWIFSGRTVRIRRAEWNELTERWMYREDVGRTLPLKAVSAATGQQGPWVLCVRIPQSSGLRSVPTSRIATATGIPERALEKALGRGVEEAQADETSVPTDPEFVMLKWDGNAWLEKPIDTGGREQIALLSGGASGLPWVAVYEDESVDGERQLIGMAPLEDQEGVLRLGEISDLNGRLPAYAKPLLRSGVPAVLSSGSDTGLRLRTGDRQEVLVIRIGQPQVDNPEAVDVTSFDDGLLVLGVEKWEETRPSLAWAWTGADRDASRSGTLTIAPPPPPWSRPEYAIPVVIWTTSILLVVMTLEARRRPMRIRPRPIMVAPIGTRMTAAMIDFMPCLLISMWVTDTSMSRMIALWPGQPLSTTWAHAMPGLLAIGMFVLSTGIMEAWSGRTAGKALTGLEVRSIDGRHPSLAQVFVRNLLKSFDMIATLLLLLMIFSRHRQRLGDIVGRTLVIFRSQSLSPQQLQAIRERQQSRRVQERDRDQDEQ